MSLLKNYLELTKPKVVSMMLITAIVGMLLATPNIPSFQIMIIALLGIGLCAAQQQP